MRRFGVPFYLLLFLSIPAIGFSQTILHSKTKFKTEGKSGLFLGGILQNKIHIWENLNGSETRIHIFDQRLNLTRKPVPVPVKGHCERMYFTSFAGFYYAFLYTAEKGFSLLNVLRIDESGSIQNISTEIAGFSNVLAATDELYLKKSGAGFYSVHRLKTNDPEKKGFIVQRFDSSFKLQDEKMIGSVISRATDLEINIPQKDILILTGSIMNAEQQNELVVQRFDLKDNSIVENGFLCGNTEFSSIRSFYDPVQKTISVFCSENPFSNSDSKFTSAVFTLFLDSLLELKQESKRISFLPKSSVGGEGIRLYPAEISQLDDANFVLMGLEETFSRAYSAWNGRTATNPKPESQALLPIQTERATGESGAINGFYREEFLSPDHFDNEFDNRLRITLLRSGSTVISDTVLQNSRKSERMLFADKLVHNAGTFSLLLNTRMIRKRGSVKMLSWNRAGHFTERFLSSHPSYYYRLNQAVQLSPNTYLVPYLQRSVMGLSIFQL